MFQFGYRPIESNALNGVKRSGRMHTPVSMSPTMISTKRRPTLASIRLVRKIALQDASKLCNYQY